MILLDIFSKLIRYGIFLLMLPLPGYPAQYSIKYPTNPALSETAIFIAHDGLSCFDRQSLKPCWHTLSGYSSDSPVATEQAILIGGSLGLHALHPDNGQVLWHLSTKARLFSPTVADGIAYVGGEDGSLRAVNVVSGQVLWQRNFAGWVYPPAIVAERLIIAGQELKLRALQRNTGALLWEIPLAQESVHYPVAIDNDTVVVTTFSADILALSVFDGSLRWQIKDSVANHSPLVIDEKLYFRTFAGPLKARSVIDGRLLWQNETHLSTRPLRKIDKALVAVNENGQGLVLDVKTGSLIKHFPISGKTIATPLLIDQRVIFFTGSVNPQDRLTPNVIPWTSTKSTSRGVEPMKNKLIVSAVAGALLGMSSAQAQPPFGGPDDTGYAATLWQALISANLAGPGALESRPYPGQHPHGAVLQTIYTTLTVDGQTNDVIVKRNYGGEGVSEQMVANVPDKFLGAVTVMFKRPGYDPDNSDWFWAKYLPDGALDKNPKGMQLAGRVAKVDPPAGCIGCHSAAPGGDMVFTR